MKKLLFVLLFVPALALAAPPSEIQQLTGVGMSPELAKKLTTLPKDNNTYIKAKNAAGSADISVLKVDATDDTVLNADSGDTIKLSVAGTAVGTVAASSFQLDQNLVFGASSKGIQFAVGTVAAAGSTAADAGAIAAKVTTVTAADATKGVILPDAPTAGDLYIIFNTANAVLKIYANSGDTINATANPSAVSVAAYVPTICVATSATQWWCAETTNP